MSSEPGGSSRADTRRNWWKIGFFGALFAFKLAREWAVMASAAPVGIAITPSVLQVGDLTTAMGRWNRIDGGPKMDPGAVKITCWRNEGRCYESSYDITDGYVGEPWLDWFPTKFRDDEISYVEDTPVCVTRTVRIDLKLGKVFAVREAKPNVPDQVCKPLERRMEMTLTAGSEPFKKPSDGHLVPLVSLGSLFFR